MGQGRESTFDSYELASLHLTLISPLSTGQRARAPDKLL